MHWDDSIVGLNMIVASKPQAEAKYGIPGGSSSGGSLEMLPRVLAFPSASTSNTIQLSGPDRKPFERAVR